ncbi:uncharacterized, partial [Tachysurus ichikawai]
IDATINTAVINITINAAAIDITIDTAAIDAIINTAVINITINTAAIDATINTAAINITIDTAVNDITIDAADINITIDTAAINITIDAADINITIDYNLSSVTQFIFIISCCTDCSPSSSLFSMCFHGATGLSGSRVSTRSLSICGDRNQNLRFTGTSWFSERFVLFCESYSHIAADLQPSSSSPHPAVDMRASVASVLCGVQELSESSEQLRASSFSSKLHSYSYCLIRVLYKSLFRH